METSFTANKNYGYREQPVDTDVIMRILGAGQQNVQRRTGFNFVHSRALRVFHVSGKQDLTSVPIDRYCSEHFDEGQIYYFLLLQLILSLSNTLWSD